MKEGFTFDEDLLLEEDDENVEDLRDDLESTKQLLELEVRSKKLLEKDNKKLQAEVEKLRAEFHKLARAGAPAATSTDHNDDAEQVMTPEQARRNSVVAHNRQNMMRLISESESSANVNQMLNGGENNNNNNDEEEGGGEDGEEVITATPSRPPPQRFSPHPVVYVPPATENELIESMKEEVDEARKLAEEWEQRYKDMQRQMVDIDGPTGRKTSGYDDGRRLSINNDPSLASGRNLHRMTSSTGPSMMEEPEQFNGEGDEEDWMQRRELHSLHNRLKTLGDKREVVFRERKLLTERIDTIVGSIGQELEARKKLRKDLQEMNEAFKNEIAEMEAEERTAAELEECYYSDDEDLVVSKPNRRRSQTADDDDEDEDSLPNSEEEDVDETLEDILKLAEDDDSEEDPAHDLFEHYPESEDEEDDSDLEKQVTSTTARVKRHDEKLQTMRKSNFMLKSKIDRLYDILQMQREKHRDLKQELTRMLADIQ